MNTETQIFKYSEFGEIRIVCNDLGEPDFCLADVCFALGLRQNDVRKRLSKEVVSSHPLSTRGGIQHFTFVNEDGLYDTILESRKPEARKFRKWVTSEVLPSIRKNGAYMTQDTLSRALAEPDFLIKLATNLKKEQDARKLAEAKNMEQMALIEEQKEIMTSLQKRQGFVDYILSDDACVTITQIAKEYGKGATWMNEFLHKNGVQFKRKGQWVLYTRYDKKNYMKSVTYNTDAGLKFHSLWTQEGRLFIYDFLRKKGLRPLVEQFANQEPSLFDYDNTNNYGV